MNYCHGCEKFLEEETRPCAIINNKKSRIIALCKNCANKTEWRMKIWLFSSVIGPNKRVLKWREEEIEEYAEI
jgi:hypothetical protein